MNEFYDIREARAEIERLRGLLAEAERNEETLLGMIRHQRDVLRECLPYLNESMAGRRPGRSADNIRAAVKALTADAALESAADCHALLAQVDAPAEVAELTEALRCAEPNARRYRWLRDSPPDVVDEILRDKEPSEWDAAIDAKLDEEDSDNG